MAGTKVLMGFALATLTAVTIAGTTITWYDGPISDRQGFIEGQISGLAGEATIGQSGDSQEAEEEFRALVAFNMLAASQCELIELIHFDEQEFEDMVGDEVDDFDGSGIPERRYTDGLNVEDSLEMNSLAERGGEDSFYVWFDGFEPLERTDFHAECYALDIDFDPTEAAAEAAEYIPGIGVGVSAARAVSEAYSSVKDTILGSGDVPFEDRDLSMEGNVGSVDFDTEANFTIDDPRLLGMRLEGAEDGSPRLWRGHRAALFMPGRISAADYISSHGVGEGQDIPDVGAGTYRTTSDDSEQRFLGDVEGWGDNPVRYYPLGHSGDMASYVDGSSSEPAPYDGNVNVRWDGGVYDVEDDGAYRANEYMWMERVRMKNIPIVSNVDPDMYQPGEKHHSSAVLDYFMANSQYIICEGTSGVIQTNAGSVDNTGDTDSDESPVWRDVVFTTVEADAPVQSSDHCITENTDLVEPGQGSVHEARPHRHDPDQNNFPVFNPDEGLTRNHCQGDEIISSDDDGLTTSSGTHPLYLSLEDDESVNMECKLVVRRRGMQYFDESLRDTDGSWGEDVTFYNLEYVFTEEIPDPQTYEVTQMFYIDDESFGDRPLSIDYEGGTSTTPNRAYWNLARFDVDKDIEITLDSFEQDGGEGTVGYIRFVRPHEEDIVLHIEQDSGLQISDHEGPMSFDKSFDMGELKFTMSANGDTLYLSADGGGVLKALDTVDDEDGIEEVVIRADDYMYTVNSLKVHDAVPRTE